MSETPPEDWSEPPRDDADTDALVVDVDGFEGPLDLLLHLSRRQKVDLARISIVALVDQYLDFISNARELRIELAADYLVMAAWLAFLKSRLLMPAKMEPEGEGGEEMAAVLQFRLQRLEAMRLAAQRLMERRQLGRDVFPRGAPDIAIASPKTAYKASLFDLLTAYAVQRQRRAVTEVRIAKRSVWALKEARELLTRLLGRESDWMELDHFLLQFACPPEERRSARASSFAASLELVREGIVEVRQEEAFQPIMMRSARSRPKLRLVK
ncbi:segregation/condensation protein A [Mesorhizobium sp. RP14(2022)]|uniref:Segregation and condensation protein A n=1 Tax=Mesorhizobium liriopis TaxID=2953882 RepID=A0ABT1CBG3_9HYPH|nr:ScpA family protein [Mesorhizobium liriopis]MCO6052033.1 segregation/condensation protein A [Mesorhizobium liriopis]